MRDAIQTHIGKLAFSLTRTGYFLATAESCTGGMIAAACTEVAGSSVWFKGGIVAYANEIKEHLLGVPASVLEEHGAVSGPTVEKMALGALRACEAQAAVAVSGVAGPGGGTRDKPVGTVWLAVAVAEQPGVCAFDHLELARTLPGCSRVKQGERAVTLYAASHHFAGDRASVRLATVERSLRDLAALLEQNIA